MRKSQSDIFALMIMWEHFKKVLVGDAKKVALVMSPLHHIGHRICRRRIANTIRSSRYKMVRCFLSATSSEDEELFDISSNSPRARIGWRHRGHWGSTLLKIAFVSIDRPHETQLPPCIHGMKTPLSFVHMQM